MAEKTLPIPERLFDALSQYKAQQLDIEATDRLLGERMRMWLEGKLGEETTFAQFQKDEQDLFTRVERAKKDLATAHNVLVVTIRNCTFDRNVARAQST